MCSVILVGESSFGDCSLSRALRTPLLGPEETLLLGERGDSGGILERELSGRCCREDEDRSIDTSLDFLRTDLDGPPLARGASRTFEIGSTEEDTFVLGEVGCVSSRFLRCCSRLS